ncbi:MAG: MoxR family ATPase [Bacilli bacterium]|nr:MoxR family ATPase [Bacilli bacterium]
MNQSINISNDELNHCIDIIDKLRKYYSERIVGQQNLQISLLTALLANGHILLESVPGLAKTTAAKVITDAVAGSFSRIQCTPDLLPSDIIGTQIFNYANNQFEPKIGPVYANFVLLDEINRSSAKTQSAMLEAMQERQITIDGKIYLLPPIFIVIATQNPIEQEGTYLLAEAQLDRFLIKEKLEYPTINEEMEILKRLEQNVFNNKEAILKLEDIAYLQQVTKRVYIDDSLKNYIANIIYATRNPGSFISEELANYIELGSSTRGTIAFMECSKALALLKGRNYVIPDDIKELRYSILRHRISLTFSAMADNVSVEQIIDAIFGAIRTP